MRIVVSDDHRVLLETLRDSLSARGFDVVATEATPEGALRAVLTHQPDVCLLDYSYPSGTCHDALLAMTRQRPDTRVVVFSATTEPQVLATVLADGACGFVSKTKSMDDLCAAIDRVVEGHLAVDPHLLHQALAKPAEKGPLWRLRFLTEREWDVLKCITQGQTTTQIAVTLGVRHATARTHVQHLLAKLGVHSRLEAAALMALYADQKTWPTRLQR